MIAEEAKDLFTSELVMTYSSDDGNTWSEVSGFVTEDNIESKPVVDFCENNEFQAYGTALPDTLNKQLALLHYPSMTDPDGRVQRIRWLDGMVFRFIKFQ